MIKTKNMQKILLVFNGVSCQVLIGHS